MYNEFQSNLLYLVLDEKIVWQYCQTKYNAKKLCGVRNSKYYILANYL